MIPKNILTSLADAKEKQQITVLVTGVFDVLHEEHVRFLKKAKEEGDILLVAIESDKRVRMIKGDERPINSQDVRKVNLEHLKIANWVMILPDDFDYEARDEFISLVRPDVLAISAHSPFKQDKINVVSKYGGEVRVVLEFNPEVSTTQTLTQTLNGNK